MQVRSTVTGALFGGPRRRRRIAETAKTAEKEEVARANTDAVFEFACQVNCHEIFARMDR
jgi:hypothetical protein